MKRLRKGNRVKMNLFHNGSLNYEGYELMADHYPVAEFETEIFEKMFPKLKLKERESMAVWVDIREAQPFPKAKR